MLRNNLFKEFLVIFFVVGIVNYMAVQNFWYWTFKDLDSAVHFLGGSFVSLGFLWLYFYSEFFDPKARKFPNFFWVYFWGVILVSVLWEAYELMIGATGVSIQQYPVDTTLDLIMDMLGGFASCLYAYSVELKDESRKLLSI